MYAFLLRPKWIVSHVLVGALIIAMIFLGFWQLDRLGQRQSTNDEVRARLGEPVTALRAITSVDDSYTVGGAVRFRLVELEGEYALEDEVLVLNRSLTGAPGYWVLTPLRQDDGTAVVVNRGWIPFRFEPGTPRVETAPPAGRVRVQGMVRETVEPQGIQTGDREGVVLEALGRPDLERYQQQLGYEIWPVYVQAEQPELSEFPVRLPRPELDEGPHLAYAAQWFIFGLIGLIGYPLVLRRVARSDGEDGRHSDIPVDYL
jgi:surfeit locus 1 family protein